MLPFLLSLLVLLGSVDVTSSQTVSNTAAGPPVVSQPDSEEAASAESLEAGAATENTDYYYDDTSSNTSTLATVTNTTTVTRTTTTTTTTIVEEASVESEEAQSEERGSEEATETRVTDNRDRATESTTINRPRDQVSPAVALPLWPQPVTLQPATTLPAVVQPAPIQPRPAPSQPVWTQPAATQPVASWTQPAAPPTAAMWTQPAPVRTQPATWTQPSSPPRTAGSCQTNEHACPCIGGTYCLFRAAACLSPNIACPSEVFGTPEVGSSTDILVASRPSLPSGVSLGAPSWSSSSVGQFQSFSGTAAGSSSVAANSQFQPFTSAAALPQFSSATFASQWPTITQPTTFGSPAVTQSFGWAPTPVTVQSGFSTTSTLPMGAPFVAQSQFAFPQSSFSAQTFPPVNPQPIFQAQFPQRNVSSPFSFPPAQPQFFQSAPQSGFNVGVTAQSRPATGVGATAQAPVFQPSQPVFSSSRPVGW